MIINSFTETVLRLKLAAHVEFDSEISELLEISPGAFSDRKKRNSFPVDKLRALAQRRPDLSLDVESILQLPPKGAADASGSALSLRPIDVLKILDERIVTQRQAVQALGKVCSLPGFAYCAERLIVDLEATREVVADLLAAVDSLAQTELAGLACADSDAPAEAALGRLLQSRARCGAIA